MDPGAATASGSAFTPGSAHQSRAPCVGRKSERQEEDASVRSRRRAGDAVRGPVAAHYARVARRRGVSPREIIHVDARGMPEERDTPFAMVTLTRGIQVTPIPAAEGAVSCVSSERRTSIIPSGGWPSVGQARGHSRCSTWHPPWRSRPRGRSGLFSRLPRQSRHRGTGARRVTVAAADLIAPWLAREFADSSRASASPGPIAR